jgi:hypothetical protein
MKNALNTYAELSIDPTISGSNSGSGSGSGSVPDARVAQLPPELQSIVRRIQKSHAELKASLHAQETPPVVCTDSEDIASEASPSAPRARVISSDSPSPADEFVIVSKKNKKNKKKAQGTDEATDSATTSRSSSDISSSCSEQPRVTLPSSPPSAAAPLEDPKENSFRGKHYPSVGKDTQPVCASSPHNGMRGTQSYMVAATSTSISESDLVCDMAMGTDEIDDIDEAIRLSLLSITNTEDSELSATPLPRHAPQRPSTVDVYKSLYAEPYRSAASSAQRGSDREKGRPPSTKSNKQQTVASSECSDAIEEAWGTTKKKATLKNHYTFDPPAQIPSFALSTHLQAAVQVRDSAGKQIEEKGEDEAEDEAESESDAAPECVCCGDAFDSSRCLYTMGACNHAAVCGVRWK